MNKKKDEHELISEFKLINPSYEYDLSNYVNNKSKIKILCDNGHNFEMSVQQHLRGYKCPICIGYKKNKDDIIKMCIDKHNGYYDYSKSTWVNLHDKVIIICPEHGEFTQSIKQHIKGNKCIKCSRRYKKSPKEFIDYCLTIDKDIKVISDYINGNTKLIFSCRKHGLFYKIPQQIKNYICDKCYIQNKNFEHFKQESIKRHSDRFDYSLSNYIDVNTKIKIIDKETGFIFEQTPQKNLSCNYFYNKRTVKDFITNSKLKHGEKYDYSKSIYIMNKKNIEIICHIHGSFYQTPNNHLQGAGCPKCNRFNIKETTIFNFIKENSEYDIIQSDRSILNGKEIDIYIPELKLGFEFNGLYWHSEIYKEKNYHIDKTKLCNDQGISLFHIWEDDWLYKQDIVKSMILNKLGRTENKIFARKCQIKEIGDNKLVRNFLNENHIQGFVGSKIKIGLFSEGELVSLMTFGNLRKSLGQKSQEGSYELLRFCNKLNTTVVGGASKLFKYFLNNYDIQEVISYSDLSRSNGNMYKQLGFTLQHNSDPNYYYIVDGIRKHRFNFRKDKLLKEGYDSTKTEIQIMNERGFYRIFDCGMQKWYTSTRK
jgi:hypothetical protein